jgi:hypothetical protein
VSPLVRTEAVVLLRRWAQSNASTVLQYVGTRGILALGSLFSPQDNNKDTERNDGIRHLLSRAENAAMSIVATRAAMHGGL